MSLGLLVFFATAAIAFGVHLKYQIPLWRARRQLYERMGKPAFTAITIGRLAEFRMFKNPEAILEESDSPDVRASKQAYIDEWRAVQTSGWIIMRILLIGFALTIVVTVLGFIVEGKP